MYLKFKNFEDSQNLHNIFAKMTKIIFKMCKYLKLIFFF